MRKRIQMVDGGRSKSFFDKSTLRSADHPWAGFTFEIANGPGQPIGNHSWSKTTLLYVIDGIHTLQWKHRGVWRNDLIKPGYVSIMRRDAEIQAAIPSGPIPMMAVQLDNARLINLAPSQFAAIDKSLISAQVANDTCLTNLLSVMRIEVEGGCASGRLYGESVSLALLSYLAGKYTTSEFIENANRRMSPSGMQSISRFIHDRLADNVSVTDMAAHLRMSPSSFARVFKSSFGVSPYQYVMKERVEKAKRLFSDSNFSSQRVAFEVGFYSQSHFAKVFRQFTGDTPKKFKAGL